MRVREKQNPPDAKQAPPPRMPEKEGAMKSDSTSERPPRKQPSKAMLNFLTVLVGLVVLAVGLVYLVLNEVPVFAIPLVVTVPVIAAVAFRNIWD
jgi:hypothetical protein